MAKALQREWRAFVIKIINCDLLECDADIIAHSANCLTTMGAGIAKLIKEKYPAAYEIDKQTVRGDYKKMGKFSIAYSSETQPFDIVNLYTQYDYGRNERKVNYEFFYQALENLKFYAIGLSKKKDKKITIGIPYKISCNNASGNWRIIQEMIRAVFENSEIDILICKI